MKTMKKAFRRASVFLMAAFAVLMVNVVAFAESSGATANDALLSAAQSTASSITANVNGILPYALGLMGVILGITIGVKVFKKLTNKAG